MPVKDPAYPADHPDVLHHTTRFLKRKDQAALFDAFVAATREPSLHAAIVLGTQWYRFSSLMSRLPSEAVGRLTESDMRHFVIQTAYEELGERDRHMIHSDLFLAALQVAGVGEEHILDWCTFPPVTTALEHLHRDLTQSASDAEILGLLHGLEIPANDIIEHLYAGLAHSPQTATALQDTPFFQIHRVVEDEHIRRGTANYLRFCPSLADKMNFAHGFEHALTFWRRFFDGLAEAIAERPHDS